MVKIFFPIQQFVLKSNHFPIQIFTKITPLPNQSDADNQSNAQIKTTNVKGLLAQPPDAFGASASTRADADQATRVTPGGIRRGVKQRLSNEPRPCRASSLGQRRTMRWLAEEPLPIAILRATKPCRAHLGASWLPGTPLGRFDRALLCP
ncbi:MAG TPA: hypothetical protein VMR94_12020 [Hyphomicrobiaceae bacterium]|nr:hypothetical protein [Hyphomicrobiaceae bacterium]